MIIRATQEDHAEDQKEERREHLKVHNVPSYFSAGPESAEGMDRNVSPETLMNHRLPVASNCVLAFLLVSSCTPARDDAPPVPTTAELSVTEQLVAVNGTELFVKRMGTIAMRIGVTRRMERGNFLYS